MFDDRSSSDRDARQDDDVMTEHSARSDANGLAWHDRAEPVFVLTGVDSVDDHREIADERTGLEDDFLDDAECCATPQPDAVFEDQSGRILESAHDREQGVL